eukprot:Pompholyxophrys_sp_v1_NODE_166_length_1404_cov_1.601927.p1 type:complete len:352 gc:universal NODE_166_length_1404_cov_1.601927:1110-55(-)
MAGVENPLFYAVFQQQATESVRIHAIYTAEVLGIPQKNVAKYYGKNPATISRWVNRFRETGYVHRVTSQRMKKFDSFHRQWIVQFILANPLSYLREICMAFFENFKKVISAACMFKILEESSFTKQVIERRAMEISFNDIVRFTMEVNTLRPLPHQLLFLDEMSTDNRAMLRKRGWFLRGHRPIYKSFFRRGARISLLSFLGVDGVVENFQTSGTFDRLKFFENCRQLLDSGKIVSYPGRNSVWILDGASIHTDASMIEYFHSRGIYIIFLPAYCPFFNPIEVVFGNIKRRCRELYRTPGSEELLLMHVMQEFAHFDASAIFKMCGYNFDGLFDPNVNYDTVLHQADLADE